MAFHNPENSRRCNGRRSSNSEMPYNALKLVKLYPVVLRRCVSMYCPIRFESGPFWLFVSVSNQWFQSGQS